MILSQIIISRPYQQAAGLKKPSKTKQKTKPGNCKNKTHSF